MSVHDDIVKSPSDDRDYLGFQLSNKLKVVVISDPTTEKAAATMNVGIGTCFSSSENFLLHKTRVLF